MPYFFNYAYDVLGQGIRINKGNLSLTKYTVPTLIYLNIVTQDAILFRSPNYNPFNEVELAAL